MGMIFCSPDALIVPLKWSVNGYHEIVLENLTKKDWGGLPRTTTCQGEAAVLVQKFLISVIFPKACHLLGHD